MSAFPVDGTWPVATGKWEKRAIALGFRSGTRRSASSATCVRWFVLTRRSAPRSTTPPSLGMLRQPSCRRLQRSRFQEQSLHDQVAPEDGTGCNLCVNVCPAKDRTNPRHKAIDMQPMAPLREAERENYSFFLNLPETERSEVTRLDHKGSQFLEPLFEYSGACAGCGETPYIKLLTQLFGDRLLIANATGCTSIYGGNLPTTPYTTNRDGRGPAWSNSLFEDNAEFGFGIRLGVDSHTAAARALVESLAAPLGDTLVKGLLSADQTSESGIAAQRERVQALRQKLAAMDGPEPRRLQVLADYLVTKSVWLLGGDGWAYDIGYGGLDHVLASNRNVNVLVLDTEVYSNTGGQQSKATPLGAVAKFASAGKSTAKKDLGLLAIATVMCTSPAWPWGRECRKQCRHFSRPNRIPAVTHHRLQPLHRPWLRHGSRHVAAKPQWIPASGRSTVSIRAAWPGRAAAPSRLWSAESAGRRLYAQRGSLPRGRAHRSRSLQGFSQGGARGRAEALRGL